MDPQMDGFIMDTPIKMDDLGVLDIEILYNTIYIILYNTIYIYNIIKYYIYDITVRTCIYIYIYANAWVLPGPAMTTGDASSSSSSSSTSSNPYWRSSMNVEV